MTNILSEEIHDTIDHRPVRMTRSWEDAGCNLMDCSNGSASRRHRRKCVFLDDVDRAMFLEMLAQACDHFVWMRHAYRLSSEGKSFKKR